MEQIRDYADLHLKTKAPEVVAYEPAIEWAHVWECYGKLSQTRQFGMAVNPVTHVEIEAFTRLHRVTIEPWEVDAILMVDGIFRDASNKKSKKGGDAAEHTDATSVKDLTGDLRKKRTIMMPRTAKAP